jgi:high-affinity nickel-transport protein
VLPNLRHRILCLSAALIASNIIAWCWTFSMFHGQSVLLGTALLAYGLGLRHAVDADHIAAIDNVTRKLMEQGRRPIGVGLFFSLGHSSIVVAASVGVALTAGSMRHVLAQWQGIGGAIGTLVSSGFLLAVAAINTLVLLDLLRSRRTGGAANTIQAGGLLSRLLRPLFTIITQSWHMYPLGLLFGLGFDTATEIALLGLSAAQASQGLHIWSILIFPALFTAGMSLIDSADSILMLGAYGWAFTAPSRRLSYNIGVTSLSVLVAALVGSLEIFDLLSERLSLHGGIWQVVSTANADLTYIGAAVIIVFTLAWLGAMAVTRRKKGLLF